MPAFWQRLGPAIDACFVRPKTILVVSAHTLRHQVADLPQLKFPG